ncbi:MAG: 2-amino-4-hydroxy-6-hydroxymethyldihydropteridine diphosphokinase [Acidimicrobiales bacterium]
MNPGTGNGRRRAFLGLGSNLGDRRAQLRAAVSGLSEVVAVSSVYETEPLGGPPGQGPYLNLVVQLDTARSPRDLLAEAHRLEAAAGRVREQRWGPRCLDVDVLWVDGVTVQDPDLTVPHPRLRERRFVLAPLAELAPDLVPSGWEDDPRLAGAVRRVAATL